MKTLKNLFTYGLLIPLIVVLLADLGIKISCKYYWGEGLLTGHSGFKLSIWLFSLTIYLTLIYYVFCILFKVIKSKTGRYLLTAATVLIPIILYDVSSPYDFRISVSFAFFHITFYVLFFVAKFLNRYFTLKKQNLDLN